MLELPYEQYYKIHYQKKKLGGYRKIEDPQEPLRSLQNKLKSRLEKVFIPSEYQYGFIKGKSVINAILEGNLLNKKYVCELDIKDFFSNITKNKLVKRLSDLLTIEDIDIACYEKKLSTGSPCSPIIANAYIKEACDYLGNLFETKNVGFLNFADNFFVSSNVAKNIQFAISEVKEIIRYLDLYIPQNKIKIMHSGIEQKILGCTINSGKISINYKIRHKLKNNIKYQGIDESKMGYLNYINSINPIQKDKLWQMMHI